MKNMEYFHFYVTSSKKIIKKAWTRTAQSFLGLLLLVLALGACSDEEGPSPITEGNFIAEGSLIVQYGTPESLDNYLNTFNLLQPNFIAFLTQQGVRVYRLVYKTVDVSGNPILASGAVIIPTGNSDPYPLVSLHHGTITSQAEAPSNYDLSQEATFFAPLFASNGYVMAVPDYIGYGASANLPHPYEHAPSLARACLDLLRATRELCQQLDVPLNNQLFLTGYSEGGYATMALHREIELNHANEFTVTASAPGAGAYHKSGFADFISNADEELSFINIYLWVLETYDWVYGLNRPWSFYLNSPYDQLVESTGIQAEVERNPQLLFTDTLRMGIKNQTDTDLLATFQDNDIHDWRPTAPIRLYHGTDDDFVPFFNSQDAFDAMQARGATQVELIPIEGANHETALEPYIFEVFNFFQDLR